MYGGGGANPNQEQSGRWLVIEVRVVCALQEVCVPEGPGGGSASPGVSGRYLVLLLLLRRNLGLAWLGLDWPVPCLAWLVPGFGFES